MAKPGTTTNLSARPREASGSREARRLRRDGEVPGVLYGGDGESVSFAVNARELRQALQASGAVIELDVDGSGSPAVLREAQRHPVRGDITHVDFVRVNLNVAIEAVVPVQVEGTDDCPGLRDGGVLDQPVREVTVLALPNEIPESVEVSVAGLVIGENASLEGISLPAGVELVDDPETVVASILAPRVEVEETVEAETELIGEGEEAPEGAEEGAGEEGGEEAGGEEAGGDDGDGSD